MQAWSVGQDDDHLAQADRHIVDGERRITEQEERLRLLNAAGQDVTEATRLLENLRATLIQLYAHREMILREHCR